MLAYALVFLAAIAPNQREFIADEVKIVASIESNIYAYTVTNLSDEPIVGFQIGQTAAYNFIAPDGWEKRISPGTFEAWTEERKKEIRPRFTGEFSMRVSSKGAVLGGGPAIVKFYSGRSVTVEDVWTPSPEPKQYRIVIAILILAIICFHTLATVIKNKRSKAASISDL